MPEIWQSIAERKKEQQRSKIPKEWLLPPEFKSATNTNSVLDVPRRCGLLSKEDLRITEEYDATRLVEELSKGRLKSVDVTRAFCKRAAIAHQLVDCLTEIFFDDALSRAAELDSYLSKHGRPVGPLHGLPISLKDTFKIPGIDASIGITGLAFSPSTIPSTLVSTLLKAGAVLYCKTNIPQTLMTLDSHNYIFGRTLNPRNLAVTAGGSSGGEGALLAMRGSPLGVGTDVGGSIRIPAMCNGLYGIKPSWERVPFSGQQGTQAEGATAIGLHASAGPIASSLRDCDLFFRAVSQMRPWDIDADVVPATWEDQQSDPLARKGKKDTVIGVVRRDGVVEPLPPIQRVLDELVSTLRSQGIEVVEMDISRLFSKCQSIANGFFGMDGNNYIFDLLAKTEEPLSPWLQSRLRRKKAMDSAAVSDLHARKSQLQQEFLEIWKDQKGRTIDAFICPVAPHPTAPIDRWNAVGYTSSFVLLDYPAATLPVRPIHPKDLKDELPEGEPLSSWDRVNRELWTKVDRSVYLNTILCVQVVVPKLQEARLLNSMQIIDEALSASRVASKANL